MAPRFACDGEGGWPRLAQNGCAGLRAFGAAGGGEDEEQGEGWRFLRLREVEPEVKVGFVAAEPEFFGEPLGTVHCALLGAGQVGSGMEPFKPGGLAVANAGGDAALRGTEQGRGVAGDGRVQLRRARGVAQEVDVLEVLAEEGVEEGVVFGGKIRPIPPEPIAPLRGVDFAERLALLGGGERAGLDALLQERAGGAEQIPGAVFLRLADPDIEVAADPRTGVEGGEAAHRRVFAEVAVEGATAQPHGIGGNAAVERTQERFAAVGKVFPRIFAVEDDGDEPLARRDVVGDALEVLDQMACGVFRRVAGGGEADEVRERAVAEDAVDGCAVVADLPALEEFQVLDFGLRVGRVAVDRLEEVFLVAAKIGDARLLQERDHFRGDGALRGPQAARTASEQALVVFDGQRQLRLGILGPVEAVGEFPARQAAFCQRGVIDEGEDGVKERGGGELHLPALLRRPVGGDDGAHDCQVDFQQPRFFGLGEVAPFFAQGGEFRVASDGGVAAPGEVEPDLEIEKILPGELPGNARKVFPARVFAALVEEFGVAGFRLDQVCPVRLEEILQQGDPLVFVEGGSRFARALQPEVGDAACDDLLDLQQEHRGEVEVEPHAGVVRDEGDHIEVTLHAVEAHPGHRRLARERVDVIGLVHVPEESHVRHAFVIEARGAHGNGGNP